MPLSAVIPVLTAGFLSLFSDAPQTTADGALRWANAYQNYCLAGGVLVPPPKTVALANVLEVAFNPEAGAGAQGIVDGLLAFWPGNPVPGMAPTAVAVVFTPTGDLSLIPPGVSEAPPAACALALATMIHLLTIASVKVVIPPSPTLVPIV